MVSRGNNQPLSAVEMSIAFPVDSMVSVSMSTAPPIDLKLFSADCSQALDLAGREKRTKQLSLFLSMLFSIFFSGMEGIAKSEMF